MPANDGEQMVESVKALLSLFMIVAGMTAALAWFEDQPDQTTWILRISGPLVALLTLTVLLGLHFRRDVVPDYLQKAMGGYFNRDGFCFAFATDVVDGVCQLHTYFQNQYERPCVGRIALRPARGFFSRASIDTIIFEIPCEAAGFGVVTLPIGLPREVQGKRQSFEVGASVEYPDGRGQRLRFRDGVFLRANEKFGDSFSNILAVAGAVGGAIVLTTPAKVTMTLPANVADTLPIDVETRMQTHWKLNDAPLNV